MPVSSIQLQAYVTGLPVTTNFDLRLNVRKDFNFLRYAPTFAGDETGVSFIDRQPLNPIQNLTITDKTKDIFENSPLQNLDDIKLVNTFTYPKGKFLLSDIFITLADSTQEPQFFKHSLTDVGFDILDVEVLDSFFNPVSQDLYVYYDEEDTLGFPSKYVYTNLRSNFNPLTSEALIFYVRYKNAVTFETFVDLLNPEPIYTELQFLSSITERTYSIEELFGENEITIHFDSRNLSPTPAVGSPRVAIKFISSDRISVIAPSLTDSNRKWKLRITNAEFFRNVAGVIEDLFIGTGDGSEDTFDLQHRGIVSSSLEVKIDNVIVTNYTLTVQTSPETTDEIVFDAPPASGSIIVSYIYDPQVARYYLPEWDDQVFSPVRPFKLKTDHLAFIINKRLLFVDPKTISNLDISGFYIYITQLDASGAVIAALTNDPLADAYITPRGTVTDIFYIKDAIQSLDTMDGIIRLNVDIDNQLETRITYRYIESYLEYTDLEVNPALNPILQDNKAIIYIQPELSRMNLTGKITTIIDQSIYYLIIDNGDNIIAASQNPGYVTVEGIVDFGTTTSLTDSALLGVDYYTNFELQILTGDHAGRRFKISSYDTNTKTISFSPALTTSVAADTIYRINKKMSSYSVIDPLLMTVLEFDGWETLHLSYPDFFVLLAEVRPNNILSVDNLNLTDIRVRGGGLIDKFKTTALGAQSEANWYWDIGNWDGHSYPGMAALLVELPRTLLQERGGPFDNKQIHDIVMRHIADGYYPILKFYDRSTEITKLTPFDTTIFVEWVNVNATEYIIKYGLNPLALDNEVTVDGAETSFLIENLDNNKKYYISVIAVINGIESFPSRLASAVPFNLSIVLPPATYGETIYSEGTYNIGA